MPFPVERCLICGSLDAHTDNKATYFLNLVEPFFIKRCGNCEFLWLDPQPTKDEYRELYGTAYLGAQRVKKPKNSILSIYPPKEEQYEEEVIPIRREWFKSRLKRLRKLLPRGRRLIDIGAGTGDFVALAIEDGWRAEGLEVSNYACERAFEKHGITLLCSDIDEFVAHAAMQFDVVHLSHVFEHLIRPREFLRGIKKLINPQGLIIIEVPNQFRSWSDNLVNFKNGLKQIERSTFSIHHPFYYGLNHIRELFLSEGFNVVSSKTFLFERMIGDPKEIFLGLVDLAGELCGGYGRNIELICSAQSTSSHFS